MAMVHQLYAGEPVKPLRLFLQSNDCMAVVFLLALAVDSAISLPHPF